MLAIKSCSQDNRTDNFSSYSMCFPERDAMRDHIISELGRIRIIITGSIKHRGFIDC